MKNTIGFILNGQKYSTDSKISLFDLIHYFGYNASLLVVEYNHFICQKKNWKEVSIQDNDKIEIVTIVGGG